MKGFGGEGCEKWALPTMMEYVSLEEEGDRSVIQWLRKWYLRSRRACGDILILDAGFQNFEKWTFIAYTVWSVALFYKGLT